MSKKDSITVSPKHGVNPSMVNCFYCGEPKGIALLGRLPKDEQSTRSITLDIVPCEACLGQYSPNVFIVEFDDITEEPTGNCWILNKAYVKTSEQVVKILKSVAVQAGFYDQPTKE